MYVTKLLLLAGVAFSAASLPALADTAAPLAQTARFDDLTIAPDALPQAAPGKDLTLTVDGVERDLAPGHYTGAVALNVTDDIPVQFMALPAHHFRAALYVDNGAPVAAKSVTAALTGARFAPGSVTDARIVSEGERFNGIFVTGSGKYEIDRPIIDFTGNGGDDFAGYGAAIMATGRSDVYVNQPIIRTRGAVRTALFTGGDATMHVDGAEIEVKNGTLPPDYKFTVEVGKMMEVPWMLGLSGNVRASNLVDRGTLYLSHSHVRTQGWGAISTDVAEHVRMYVSDSLIETVDSGYGCYSIGDSIDSFSHSVIRAADIGCIIAAEGSVTFTDGTIVESGRYGVMMHSGVGGGTLTIDKGSELHAASTAIEVKGRGTTIVVDGARITSGNRTILQAMENDDPFMKTMKGPMGPGGPGGGPIGVVGGPKGPPSSPDVVATFRNAALDGDFWNGRTAQGTMTLGFENARVTGVISTSTTAPATGAEPTRETYREIGHVANTPTPTATANGLALSLDGSSHWTVTGTCYLTALTLAPGALVEAPAGHRLVLTVNGKAVKLHPGNYKGRIELSLS